MLDLDWKQCIDCGDDVPLPDTKRSVYSASVTESIWQASNAVRGASSKNTARVTINTLHLPAQPQHSSRLTKSI